MGIGTVLLIMLSGVLIAFALKCAHTADVQNNDTRDKVTKMEANLAEKDAIIEKLQQDNETLKKMVEQALAEPLSPIQDPPEYRKQANYPH